MLRGAALCFLASSSFWLGFGCILYFVFKGHGRPGREKSSVVQVALYLCLPAPNQKRRKYSIFFLEFCGEHLYHLTVRLSQHLIATFPFL